MTRCSSIPRRGVNCGAVIDWFEERGKTKLLRDDLDALWVSDFLDFIKRERIFDDLPDAIGVRHR